MVPLHRGRRVSFLAAAVSFAIVCIARSAGAQDTTITRTLPPVQVHGFLEVYYRLGDPTIPDGFRLRKSDLKFSGELSPHLRWRVGFDASKALALTKSGGTTLDTAALRDVAIDQRSRMLQDAAMTYTVSRKFSVDVGQQIVPLGLEGTYNTWSVETIERTLFIVERSRAVGLGDVRDVGVSVNGQVDVLEYHVGTFNEVGDSQGTTDTNDEKAIVGRVAIHAPGIPSFQFGGSGAFEGGPPSQHRERAAGEAQYRDARITLRTEAMTARDGALHRFGWYGLGAYRPTSHVQFVARYDNWDRDRTHEASINDAFQRQITGGVHYLIDGAAGKIALNVVHQTFPNVASPRAGTFLLAAFEALW